jgi:hypothetical protein
MLARAHVLVVLGLAALGVAACADLEPPAQGASGTPSADDEPTDGSCTTDKVCPTLNCACGRFDARLQRCTNGVCATTCADVGCSELVVRDIRSHRP